MMVLDKQFFRDQCLARRDALDRDQMIEASKAVVPHVLACISPFPPGMIVAGYAAMRGELDVFPTLAQLAVRGHSLCLPVIGSPRQPLLFRRWHPGGALVREHHGIAVPPPSAAILQPDILLVPLLAFDAAGHRLGYGGGYYDRTIQRLRATKKNLATIGIGYALQQVAQLPITDHDQRLDAAVTEDGIIRFAGVGVT